MAIGSRSAEQAFDRLESQDARAHGVKTTHGCTSTVFPATPVGDRRILRVFCERESAWPAAILANRRGVRGGRPALLGPTPNATAQGSATLLRSTEVTKSTTLSIRRSDASASRFDEGGHRIPAGCGSDPRRVSAGSTWIAFTDQVSHAAMAGQYQFEQTFLVAVDAMLDEQRSPLRILERITGRSLV